MGSPRNNAPPSKFDTGSFSFHASGAAAADLQQARDRLQAEADESPPASPAARSDFEGFGVSPPRRDVELENAEDAVRARRRRSAPRWRRRRRPLTWTSRLSGFVVVAIFVVEAHVSSGFVGYENEVFGGLFIVRSAHLSQRE